MTADKVCERIAEMRSKLGALVRGTPSVSPSSNLLLGFANHQLGYVEMLSERIEGDVSEEVLLNLGYARGLIDAVDRRELSRTALEFRSWVT